MKNIYSVGGEISFTEESFVELLNKDNCVIEKIISTGQSTEKEKWLEEKTDEWVILLQGESEISFFSGERYNLKKGNYLFIPSFTKHRVESTTSNPPCIWLAIHIKG